MEAKESIQNKEINVFHYSENQRKYTTGFQM